MNKTTAALKLAEEALHNTGNALMCLTTTRNLRPMYQEMRDDATEGCNKALAAIREALAEQEKQERQNADEWYEKLLWDKRDGIDPSTDYPETYDQGGGV